MRCLFFQKHLLHYGRKHVVTGCFVATNHRGPVPKVTEPAPFCDLICEKVRRFAFEPPDQGFGSFFLVVTSSSTSSSSSSSGSGSSSS